MIDKILYSLRIYSVREEGNELRTDPTKRTEMRGFRLSDGVSCRAKRLIVYSVPEVELQPHT
jgi:hypothetical protein